MALTHEEKCRVKELWDPAELVEALSVDWEDFPKEDLFYTYEDEIRELLEEY